MDLVDSPLIIRIDAIFRGHPYHLRLRCRHQIQPLGDQPNAIIDDEVPGGEGCVSVQLTNTTSPCSSAGDIESPLIMISLSPAPGVGVIMRSISTGMSKLLSLPASFMASPSFSVPKLALAVSSMKAMLVRVMVFMSAIVCRLALSVS